MSKRIKITEHEAEKMTSIVSLLNETFEANSIPPNEAFETMLLYCGILAADAGISIDDLIKHASNNWGALL